MKKEKELVTNETRTHIELSLYEFVNMVKKYEPIRIYRLHSYEIFMFYQFTDFTKMYVTDENYKLFKNKTYTYDTKQFLDEVNPILRNDKINKILKK